MEYISEAVVRNNNLGVSLTTIRLAYRMQSEDIARRWHCGSSYKLEPDGRALPINN